MPNQKIRQRVNRRLEELYRRHLPLHDDEVVSYYQPEVVEARIAPAEQKPFAICLATTDGEVFCAVARPSRRVSPVGSLAGLSFGGPGPVGPGRGRVL